MPRLPFRHLLALSLAAAVPALILEACAAESASTGIGGGNGGSAGSGAANNGGQAGGDASIDITTGGGGGAGGGGGEVPLSELCGQGPCTPDVNETCVDPGTGDVDCKLVAQANRVQGSCLTSGAFTEGQPCVVAADCGPGLGCVSTPAGGVCRAYCCGDPESCGPGTYCAKETLAEDGASEIPACRPSDDCTLLGPGPDRCADGLVCTIVKSDGTTACVVPGTGTAGAPCPCAGGFVCSQLTDTCLQLCATDGSGDPCPPGSTCQGGAMNLPAGVGLCVS